MSWIASHGADGVQAGIGFLVVAAIAFLLRRVASLQRALEALAEAVAAMTEEPGTPDEPSGRFEDDDSIASRRRFQSADSIVQGEQRRTTASLPIGGGDAQREREANSYEGAMAAYNALVAQFGQAELQAFEQRWHPKAVARTTENCLTNDPNGDFWLIRTGDLADSRGFVVPGSEVVRKWELYYRSMGGLAAKRLLGGLYDIGDDAQLRLEQPAIATRTDLGWKVEAPGKFADG